MQVGTRRKSDGRRCENETDSRCMCTGWAFFPRVGEWVTRRDITKDILCQLKYMTGMHTTQFVDIRNDCIFPIGGNGYKLR